MTHLIRLTLGAATVALLAAYPARADIRDDVARCAVVADDAARLICFDNAASDMAAANAQAARQASDALRREFRFNRNSMTGPLSFRLDVSGNLILSRETMAAREVEETVRRIVRTIGAIEGWSLDISVHGAKVALSRGNPYSGGELLAQARAGMARTGLPEDRYTVSLGEDAEPVLWDDGRVRSANEHIDIDIIGLGDRPSR